jgi:hypothetical protein
LDGSQQVGVVVGEEWGEEGGKKGQPRSGTQSNRNVFLRVELYERSKSRPTPSGGAMPESVCVSAGPRQVEKGQKEKKGGGQKWMWPSSRNDYR